MHIGDEFAFTLAVSFMPSLRGAFFDTAAVIGEASG
jgi:hypothetical protein